MWRVLVHEKRGSGTFLISDPRLPRMSGSPGIFLQAIGALCTINSNIITNSRYVTMSVYVLCQLIKSSEQPHDITVPTPLLKGSS